MEIPGHIALDDGETVDQVLRPWRLIIFWKYVLTLGLYHFWWKREVLALMAEGRSNAGIAHQLWVTEGTIEKHVRSIMSKLNLPDTGEDHRRVLAVIAFLDAR